MQPVKVSGPDNVVWPHYKCHKIVAAVKIVAINKEWAAVEPKECGPLLISPDWQARYKPEVGGYVVAYDDGYMSFSPVGAFEGGYDRIDTPRYE